MAETCRRVVVAHPSADQYGSDLQVLLSVKALVEVGWGVTLVLPQGGPLVTLASGIDVRFMQFAVLRKSYLSAIGLVGLALRSFCDVIRICAFLRSEKPDLVYANTMTIPTWMLAARLCRIPLLVHVHEAESGLPRAISTGLTAPLLLGQRLAVNSNASAQALTDVIPRLRARIAVVYNGVPDPGATRTAPETPPRLVYIGRLSPRKGVDIAIDALAQLISEGVVANLDICGSTFPGYEDYEAELRARAAQPDLSGKVRFLGYVRPVSDVLSRAAALVMPSRSEPFGNVAVEALMAGCPVIASRVQGLQEVVQDEATGLLVPPDDPRALADAIKRVLSNPIQAAARANAGRAEALSRFSTSSYCARIAELAIETAES